MAQDSQVKNKQPIDILEGQIRECFGKVVYTHKTQEKCADIALTTHNQIKLLQIILSVATTTGIFITILGKNQLSAILSIIVSTLLTILNTYTKDYDLGAISQRHTEAASQLWSIRESYFSLLTDIKTRKLDIEKIMNKRDILQKELADIYQGAPRTNIKAYRAAVKGLKVDEELTFTDKEIDMFLPKELRRNR